MFLVVSLTMFFTPAKFTIHISGLSQYNVYCTDLIVFQTSFCQVAKNGFNCEYDWGESRHDLSGPVLNFHSHTVVARINSSEENSSHCCSHQNLGR